MNALRKGIRKAEKVVAKKEKKWARKSAKVERMKEKIETEKMKRRKVSLSLWIPRVVIKLMKSCRLFVASARGRKRQEPKAQKGSERKEGKEEERQGLSWSYAVDYSGEGMEVG